ncbi:branched-chain amino acid ABC transporter permease [Rhizobium sp. RU36D]|uniref:branched-chain amino acid ABC transporter permease n=1 Tax=Rhizobium sp. RU36D TaxID=1907415 RepID=UPI0009D7B452|nr:branched-chain amino acid ABC transporter permease [Rhizobium sp. RU36D]SMC98811.1 amino acid/amide ABC transporter membrane protein 2, HAAT family [Rhizobium sp. RU36D]
MISRENTINLALVAALLAAALIANWLGETFYITLATRIAILALAATGLNLVLGLGGLVSFGHAVYFGIGGYAAGILSAHVFSGEPLLFGLGGTDQMPVIWIVAALVSGLLAVLIGAISLRTSGVYFIMITLAFAQMVYYFAVSWPAYGGEDGLSILVRNQFPGLNTMKPLSFFLVCYVLLLLGIVFFSALRRSRFGTALEVIRQNETRAASVGISPFPVKLVAFVLSGMITGIAGALFADLNRFVSPSMMSWHMSGELIVLIILGGTGRLMGPLAGAALYILIEHYLGEITERWQFFLGLILLGTVLFARGGLLGLLGGRARHG